jgi:phage gp29-like protein
MARKKFPENQIVDSTPLPEYAELTSIMQNETASIITDYIRQYVGYVATTPEPGSGIFINWDRVLQSQAYQELAWYELYNEVERDPHILAVMQSAKLNVAGMKWDIDPYMAPKDKKVSARNEAIAEFVKDTLEATGHFPQHLFNSMDALGKGFSVSEILWNVDGSQVTIKNIINRPQRRFQFDAVDRSLKLRNINQPYYGITLPDKKFIVHRCSSTWDNPFGDALDQSLYWMWIFKKTVFKFWMQHLQVGASSIPIVKHPVSANAQLKTEALSIAQMIRNGAYGRIPDNFEIIWAEAKNAIQNAQAYQQFIRTVDDQISKCIAGQTLTTEASSSTGTGTHAQGKIHQQTMNQRDVFRAEGLMSTYNSSVIKWLVDYNFANVEGYPRFRFDLENPQDLVNESTIVKNLAGAGYDFDPEELGEKFNYTITKGAKPVNPFEKNPANEAEPIEEPIEGQKP